MFHYLVQAHDALALMLEPHCSVEQTCKSADMENEAEFHI